MKNNTDIFVERAGSIVCITPITPAGREWIDENCPSEPWQWTNATLTIDRRFADEIMEGMQEAGLNLE